MNFDIKVGIPDRYSGDCVVIGVFESGKLAASAKKLDKATQAYLKKILALGDMTGKINTTQLVPIVSEAMFKRILLVGLGKEQDFNEKQFFSVISAVLAGLQKTAISDVTFFLADFSLKKRSLAWQTLQIVLLTMSSQYRFQQLKSSPDNDTARINKISLFINDHQDSTLCEESIRQGKAISQGMDLTKNLGNLAPNICTPDYLAKQAKDLAKSYKLKFTLLEEKDMEKLKMGALLAVARGSEQPAKLIILEYNGASKKGNPIALVGKGVTFDTGGISLKPAPEMDEMKYDMSGAGSVLGTLLAIAELKLPINVVGIIPATENMPSGRATKPGDVVTSMSGQTIEILNTDAEGRLILCDALTYAAKYNPKYVIDIATLTGACVIALGNFTTGLIGNDETLVQELVSVGDSINDRVWHLPMTDEYQELLKSNFADMANIGGRAAGTITAACFLSRFAHSYRWAHLDIAGTAWKSGKEKGATGRPVPLLTQFLINQANHQQ